jgi:hypothetical protein
MPRDIRKDASATQNTLKLTGQLPRTFPRLFFSRLYWQTYSSSMQREHGDCPLHLVRMRWQWSHARLTLRLTGAEPLRSCLGMSTAVESIVATASEKIDEVEARTAVNGKIWGCHALLRDVGLGAVR